MNWVGSLKGKVNKEIRLKLSVLSIYYVLRFLFVLFFKILYDIKRLVKFLWYR